MKQTGNDFSRQITKTVHLNYFCHLPAAAKTDPQKKWPLIFFLHGAGERGNDLTLIKKHGIPKEVELAEDFPFITIAPQCPEAITWAELLDEVHALLEYALQTYPADPEHVYLTGMSMGGFGTFAFAAKYPQYFTAIAPICGGSPWLIAEERVHPLAGIPIWVFHGAKDDVVPVEMSQTMVQLMQAQGADVKFTIYPEAKHDAWTATYSNPELYKWFLAHKKNNQN